MKNERQQKHSLILLYGLLLLDVFLLHHVFQSALARLFFVVVSLCIIVFWRYLNKKQILTLSFFSSLFQGNLSKNERRFLYAIPLIFMPILRLQNISVSDLVISLLLVVITVLLSILDRKQFFKKQ